LIVAVYLLVYYQHPDDRNDAYFPKVVVIIGIMLAGATCLLLPLDVANNEEYAGT
jgi:LMBR1 domain-containing protein 1